MNRPGSAALSVVLTLACLACDTPSAIERAVERPNILLIVADDLRPDLGSFGHPMVRSPEIDRLAAAGIRFERAYAQFPACNPSRASLLTGLRPETTGVLDNRTPLPRWLPDVVTFPELFRRHGYFTASIGKVFHGAGRRGRWTATGAWDLELFPRAAKRVAPQVDEVTSRGRVGRYSWRMSPADDRGLQDSHVVSRAVEVLEQSREEPFLVAVGLSATHPHFVAPQPFFELYPLSSIVPPQPEESSRSLVGALQGWSDEDSVRFTEEQKRQLIRAYWACLSFLDAQVGRLLDTLDRLDLTRSTVVVLVSDHGYHLGEQGWWSKRTLYEAALRVPLIIRAPAVGEPGASSQRLVELVDLYPTLAELAGLETPSGLEGRSLVPLMEDPQRDWKPAAFSQLKLGRVLGRSVRTEDWRYTEWSGDQQAVELFEYRSRSTESINHATDPAYADVRRRLAALLQ